MPIFLVLLFSKYAETTPYQNETIKATIERRNANKAKRREESEACLPVCFKMDSAQSCLIIKIQSSCCVVLLPGTR
jgi:hypothetical protein